MFMPLSKAEPQLQTLIDLVTTNGYIIGQSSQPDGLCKSDILKLESVIGKAQSRPLSSALIGPAGGLAATYEPLARIHMLWYV